MAEQRETTPFRLHDVRLIRTRDLWNAPDKFKGQPVAEANRRFKCGIIVPKTAASQIPGPGGLPWAWLNEPQLKPVRDALERVYQQYMGGRPLEYLKSPVKDGDMPNEQGKVAEHLRGHWSFTASCGIQYPPNIEGIVSGQVIPFPAQTQGGRKFWDDGDHASVDCSLTKSGKEANEFVIYLNSVLFLRAGERIASGIARASGEEMMREAAAKGYAVTGINGSTLPAAAPGFATGAPQPFGGAPAAAPGFATGAPPNFHDSSLPPGDPRWSAPNATPPQPFGGQQQPHDPFQPAAAPPAAPAPFGTPNPNVGPATFPSSPALAPAPYGQPAPGSPAAPFPGGGFQQPFK